MNSIKSNTILFFFCLFCYSCNNDKITRQQEIIDSLRQANIELQNKLPDEKRDKLDIDKILSKLPNGNKDAAIKAIKYQLAMYHPEVKYSSIRTVLKTNKTTDVILDIPDEILGAQHKYYNVSTFDDGTYIINNEWGVVF